MATLRQDGEAERELMQAERAVLEEQAKRGPVGDCPSAAVLQRFAAGREDREEIHEEILAHLAACSRCVQFMAELRRQKVTRSGARRAYTVRSALALAAGIIVAVSIWVWSRKHHEFQVSNQVATIDLRQMSPTRGGSPNPPVTAVKVPRQAGQLRLILPVGSEGTYEAGLFRRVAQGAPLLRDSGHTNLEDHDVVLVLKLRLAGLDPGRYWLGLRQGNSDWAFFPLSVD
jgi:hypothetical protein